MDSPSTPLPVAYGSDTTFTETFPLHEQAEPAEESERKRQEALRYFEEVFVTQINGKWHELTPMEVSWGLQAGDVLTLRGAFERYQRLGVAVYGEGG